MKLIQVGGSHPKNEESIRLACAKLNIEFDHIFNMDDILRGHKTCDILWVPTPQPQYDILPSNIPIDIKIIYGPQFFTFPDNAQPIVGPLDTTTLDRCVYVCLSNWIYTMFFEFVNSFKVNLTPIPFGVNVDKFTPTDDTKLFDFIVMFKNRNPSDLDGAHAILNSKKYTYKTFKYGSYNEDDYLFHLRRTKAIIWIGCHESQGFGLEEALSCNVPMLLWDVTSMFQETINGVPVYDHLRGIYELKATSAPYWSDVCGKKVYTLSELEETIDLFSKSLDTYSPRSYILENLRPEDCLRNMFKHINLDVLPMGL